ncbi:MAG: 2-amino-4-oxopentanoate thiolase subunit OrtA [Bacillota bacterium]|nr:2-amino-4-oxopentanoate thiolase subunit OrtA [Bacillota bacterium]
MTVSNKGQWVEVHDIILEPGQRAPQVPEDTAKVPLEMRAKGFLLDEGEIGETVRIETLTGRIISGKLSRINPEYGHSFGKPVKELLEVGPKVRDLLEEVWEHE